MGLILPRWGLTLPRIPPRTPVLYSAVTIPSWGYVRAQNIPNPTPKHPFSWPELENGQNELLSRQNGPQLGQIFENWASVSRSGQKTLLMIRSNLIAARATCPFAENVLRYLEEMSMLFLNTRQPQPTEPRVFGTLEE